MTESEPLISVIVPVYGTEDYLPACIESICGQSYKNTEIILVDDESPDRCPEICDKYAEKDKRILVVHQKNKGVSGARNTGLKHASGDYITFVDSDDELYPEALETMLRDSQNYTADIVSAVKKQFMEKGNNDSTSTDDKIIVLKDDESLILSLMGEKNTNSACAKLFSKDFIKDIFFEEGKNIHEDGFFMFQCCIRKPVWVQHDILIYQYNFRPGSGSRQPFSEKYLSIFYFLEEKKKMVAEYYPELTDEAKNMEVRCNLQMLDLLCRTTDKKYSGLQKQCINTVCKLYKYHKSINNHHKKLAWIVKHGLYPIYKMVVRFKYYKQI